MAQQHHHDSHSQHTSRCSIAVDTQQIHFQHTIMMSNCYDNLQSCSKYRSPGTDDRVLSPATQRCRFPSQETESLTRLPTMHHHQRSLAVTLVSYALAARWLRNCWLRGKMCYLHQHMSTLQYTRCELEDDARCGAACMTGMRWCSESSLQYLGSRDWTSAITTEQKRVTCSLITETTWAFGGIIIATGVMRKDWAKNGAQPHRTVDGSQRTTACKEQHSLEHFVSKNKS